MMARLLCEILREAGLPDGVLTILPGFGDVGQALVDDPRVDLIAFTGSRDVGLEINRRAAEARPGQDHVKRVIAEMGGKNAIIVDDDADLDEAVVGVLHSAFGYAGQKCSACSRVIVLDGVHDAFLARLVEAARALPVGPADDPETVVGPVIDARARERIEEYRRIAATEGRVVLSVDLGPLAAQRQLRRPADRRRRSPGGPHRPGGDLRPGPGRPPRPGPRRGPRGSPTAPPYALTGGLYSRSPAQHRPRQARVPGRQPLHQPADHRRPGRSPAVRRLQALGHRHQGGRARLPAGIPADPHRHREHDAPRLRPRGGGTGRVAIVDGHVNFRRD